AERLVAEDVGSLVIVVDGVAHGIITEADIVAATAAGIDPATVDVAQWMSAPVVTVKASATLGEAASVMAEQAIQKLPVVDDRTLVGIVTTSDLARYIPEYRWRTLERG
ncbi:MAG: cyclic nucleotide-binding/CBS domain-containing protein, partial [Halobacteriota archaeon]